MAPAPRGNQGTQARVTQERMTNHNTPHGRWWLVLAGLATLGLAACSPNNGQNSVSPHGTNAHRIDNLILPIWGIAIVIGLIVVGGVVFVAVKYRQRPGNEHPKQIRGNIPIEIAWTMIPAVILAVIAIPTVSLIFQTDSTPSNPMNVTVIGKQWWWQFEYPGSASQKPVQVADELHIPSGRNIDLTLKGCDPSLPYGFNNGPGCNVIHSFWVPELAGKRDVIPGRDNHLTLRSDSPGTFLGQCAQYCGLSHANMRFRVIVQTPSDFDTWLASQRHGPAVTLAASGDAGNLFSKTFQCTNCHVTENSSVSTYGPNLTHLGSRSTFASGYFALTRPQLIKWILNAPSLIPMESKDCRKGVPGTPGVTCVGMPSFTTNTPHGMPVMTEQQAGTLADYLLSLK
jgi:cytochrome c oxidase subunit 2